MRPKLARGSRQAMLALWTALFGSTALAQPSDHETGLARGLFQQGIELARREQWAEAADRFRRALAVRSTHAIRYNYASALAQVGRLVEATEHLRLLVNDPAVPASVRASAQPLLADVQARIGHLTIHVRGDRAGGEVSLDGRPLQPAFVGVAVPADPGQHVVVLRRGGTQTERQVRLGERESAEVVFEEPAPAAAQGPVRPATSRRGPLPWLVTGGSSALAITGVVLVVLALNDLALVQNPPPGSSWPDIAPAHDRAPVLSTLGFVLGGLGIAGAVAGVLWLTSGTGGERRGASLAVGPGGFLLRGAF